MLVLTSEARKNLLNCFEKHFGKETFNYRVVELMSDSQLCEYWSKTFD